MLNNQVKHLIHQNLREGQAYTDEGSKLADEIRLAILEKVMPYAEQGYSIAEICYIVNNSYDLSLFKPAIMIAKAIKDQEK